MSKHTEAGDVDRLRNAAGILTILSDLPMYPPREAAFNRALADWLSAQGDLSQRGHTQDPRHAAALRVADLVLEGPR